MICIVYPTIIFICCLLLFIICYLLCLVYILFFVFYIFFIIYNMYYKYTLMWTLMYFYKLIMGATDRSQQLLVRKVAQRSALQRLPGARPRPASCGLSRVCLPLLMTHLCLSLIANLTTRFGLPAPVTPRSLLQLALAR